MEKQRFNQLDSLRGVAALSVLLHHYLYILPSIYGSGTTNSFGLNLIKYSPLHLLWAGTESVMFFFVLSGFVLALPFLNGTALSYKNYIIKRICRIYIPYIIAVITAIVAATLFSRWSDIPDLSVWFNSKWDEPLDLGSILGHLTLIFSFNNGEYDPVLWSLVQEMRASLFFPIIMYFVMKYNWKITLGAALFLSIVGYGGHFVTYHITSMNLKNDYFISLHYLLMFVVGSLLAKHRLELVGIFQRLNVASRLIAVLIAILSYTYAWWFLPHKDILHIQIINEWFNVIGVALFLLFAISYNKFKTILELSPIHFFGKISYSLYLYHAIAMLTFVNLWYGKMPLGWILLISFVVSLILATVSYYFVEKSSIKIGNKLTNKSKINKNTDIKKIIAS
ncbi:acyltransferase family protein [Paenibacillus sp. SI8]|uniref:acyltransferase family protein n=1 Tax=unclassified Paenibacillus TaxID=185978 RepID=UPI003467446C